MPWDPISKSDRTLEEEAREHRQEREAFSWDDVRARLSTAADGRRNIAREAVDRHVEAGRGDQVAIRWLGADDERRDLTYARPARRDGPLRQRARRPRRSQRGDRVFLLMRSAARAVRRRTRDPALRRGLSPAVLGVRARTDPAAACSSARAACWSRPRSSTAARSQRSATDLPGPRARAAGRRRRRRVRRPGRPRPAQAAGGCLPDHESPTTAAEDLALLHFTSGTTGTPKGAMHVHEAVVHHLPASPYALDLHPDDVFWCTADPGLGDRHQLRDHRAAGGRRDDGRRRGRVRRPSAGTGSSRSSG